MLCSVCEEKKLRLFAKEHVSLPGPVCAILSWPCTDFIFHESWSETMQQLCSERIDMRHFNIFSAETGP